MVTQSKLVAERFDRTYSVEIGNERVIIFYHRGFDNYENNQSLEINNIKCISPTFKKWASRGRLQRDSGRFITKEDAVSYWKAEDEKIASRNLHYCPFSREDRSSPCSN